MARNLYMNPKKHRPEVNRDRRKMRRVESKGLSTCCIVSTLLGLAAVALLAVVICVIASPSETQNTNHNHHRTIQNNRHNQTIPDHTSPADGMATIKIVLIVFSTATISLTVAIFTTCIIIQRSKKKRPRKQTDGRLLPRKNLNKSLENIERNTVEDNQREIEDDDETSCKNLLMSQRFPKNVTNVSNKNAVCIKINQFEVCNERNEIVDVSTSEIEVQKQMSESSKTKPFREFTYLNKEGLKCSDKNIRLTGSEVDQIQPLDIVTNEKGTKQVDTEPFLDDTTKSVILFKVNNQNHINPEAVNNTTKSIYNDNLVLESKKCLIDKNNENQSTVSEKEDSAPEIPKKENACHVQATSQSPDKEDTSIFNYFEGRDETKKAENNNTHSIKDLLQQEVERDECLHGRLNWDKVFIFLAGNMPPSNHHIFFIHLYDSVHDIGGGSISNVIALVDNDAKGLETQSRFLRHFQKWKELLGKRASIWHIKDALKQMGYEETLHKLEDFMRQPPLLPQQRCDWVQLPESLHSNEKFKDTATSKELLVKESRTMFGVFESHKNGNKTFLYQTQDTQRAGVASIDVTKPSDAANQAVLTLKALGRKRLRSMTESSSEQDFDCNPSKSRRLKPRPRRILNRRMHATEKRSNKCDRLVEKDSINPNFVLDLIKTLISNGNAVNKICYHLFMRHTVRIIMKKARVSEEQVLSLSCDDVAKCEKKVSSRGHEAFIIEFVPDFKILHRDEWDCLELYKGQREKVCARLLSENSDYIDSKYIFINYDGYPLKEQADQEKTTDEYSSQSENSSETTETSTEQGDEICKQTSENTEPFEISETSNEDSEEKYDKKKMPSRQSGSICNMEYVAEVKKQPEENHAGESRSDSMESKERQKEVTQDLKRSLVHQSTDEVNRITKLSQGNNLKIMDIALD